jgi:hypothetical protein
MAQVDFTATFDSSQVVSALGNITDGVEAGQKQLDALSDGSVKSFDAMATGAKKTGAAVVDVVA